MARPVCLFMSFAEKDEPYLAELEKHLQPLQQQGVIEPWSKRRIFAGEAWAEATAANLENADIFLPLISSDYLASPDCYQVEMQKALARHQEGTAYVIPVVVRPISSAWLRTSLGKLKSLPTERPVSK
jgi:hypothetical protein